MRLRFLLLLLPFAVSGCFVGVNSATRVAPGVSIGAGTTVDLTSGTAVNAVGAAVEVQVLNGLLALPVGH